jgi:hypothetical protein
VFRTRFVPSLRDFAGTIEPWQQPSKEDVHRLLLAAFPGQNREVESELTCIIEKLVRISHHVSFGPPIHRLFEAGCRVAEWRNRFASTAMKFLENTFLEQGLNTPAKRANYVGWMLGDNNRDCPFYYKIFKKGTIPVVNFIHIPFVPRC